MTILVTDGETRAALAVVRSLAGFTRVIVGAASPESLAGASNACADHWVLPSPLTEPDAFVAAVAAGAQREGIDGILPVTDAACSALLPARDRLAPVPVLGPSAGAYSRLSDKAAVAERAAVHGLASPNGRCVSDLEEALETAQSLGFPVVLKPALSVAPPPSAESAGQAVRRKHGVIVAADADAVRAAWAALGERVLVQERVPGWGEGLFVLRHQGRLRAAFAHRRLREKPPGGGVSVLCESIPCDPDRLAAVAGLLAELEFEGLAMAELKCDGARSWLMEFNARPWGSLQLAIDAGVDFPRLLWEWQLHGRGHEIFAYAHGRRLRWWLGDVDHALALARGRPACDGARGPIAALRVLLGHTGPGSRLELWRRDDPAPFFHALGRWLRRLPD